MKFVSTLLLGSVFATQFAAAEPLKIDLDKELAKLPAKNLYDLDPKTKDGDLNVLSRMKYFEIKKRWKDCAGLGAKVSAANPEIHGWVISSWLKCELKDVESAKDKKALQKPVDWLGKHKNLMQEGPWKNSLWKDYVTASLALLDAHQSPGLVDALLEQQEQLPKEARGTVLFYAGDAAEKKKQTNRALYFYEQSLLQKEDKGTRERLEAMKSLLKLKFNTSSPGIDGVLENEGAEAALEEKMTKSLKASDLMGALKVAVVIQTEYAGSKVARRLKDKPFEIYQQMTEGTSGDTKDEKALHELEKIDSMRIAEWAQTLHRRADYNQALIFAESALKDLYQTPQATNLYWIAGRSAHFLGQYDRALMHYAKLIEFHAGSDESAEAMMRSGLIHLRLKNFSSAKGQFEKLMAQKKDRYDLIARYWLIRSLQNLEKDDKDRATTEAAVLVDKYPFSYYGLRLNAEANQGEFKWPDAKPQFPAESASLWLVGEQRKAWSRFKILSKAGWLLEAQSEAQLFPTTKNPWLEYEWAKFYSKNFQFPGAIRLMSDAMDLENSLRTKETLELIYPKSFSPWIESESKKYSLNPDLVRSLIRQESAFGIRAQSTSNAQGLMQLIPPTAQDVARRIGIKKLEFPEDVFRPEINIPLGTYYISAMIDQFGGSVPMGLAAYNAGPTKVKIFIEARKEVKDLMAKPSSEPFDEIWFDELPWNETSFYVKAILRNSLLYKLIDAEKVDWTLVLWQDLHNKKANIK